ncbi:MAG: DUF1934 domain-containing protein [Clostridia bacterium]|nr:DUF1934 domain-containing protein [Clostridia bacterium]
MFNICYATIERRKKEEIAVKKCRLTIITSVDGQETEFSTEGELVLSVKESCVRYCQDGSVVELCMQGETARIKRFGDYSLFLELRRGERTKGRLGIGGSEGEIEVDTHKVAYSQSKDSFLAVLHYDLLIGVERQKMKLRILARKEAKTQR